LEKRPIDADLEKKQGDPLFDATKFSESHEEVLHTGKLARELPEYHQGEARLKPHGVLETSDVLPAQAVLLAENAKEIAQESKEFIKEKAAEGYIAAVDATQTAAHIAQEKALESKEFVQEKAHEAYDSAVKQADTLLDKAYQGEQYIVEKAVDAELYIVEKAVDAEAYLEEKGKQAKAKAADLLVNTIAPAVGYALGSAYVALTHATGYVVEKSREEIEYLENQAEHLKEDAVVIGQEMASEAKHLKDEALVLGSEMAKEASEKTKTGIAIASEVGKETLVAAAEKTNHTMEYLAEKRNQTMEYLEKEAEILSNEGAEFVQHQKQYVAGQMEKIAEDAKHNPDAAALLRELADETEIKSKSADVRNEEFMKSEFDQALKLKKEHDLAAKQAAQKANFIQHEKQFEDTIAKKLTDSLRASHIEAEERALEEGSYQAIPDESLGSYQVLVENSPMASPMEVTKGELKPLLHHQAQFTEPASPLNV